MIHGPYVLSFVFFVGNLIIEFDVDFPVSLSSEQLAVVAGAFPESKKKAKIGGDDAAAGEIEKKKSLSFDNNKQNQNKKN